MIGWEPVPPIPGGNEDVEKCLGPYCGALVRTGPASGPDRRPGHDREFHQEDKPASILAHDLTDALLLLRRFLPEEDCYHYPDGHCFHGVGGYLAASCAVPYARALLDRYSEETPDV